jgi:hypothetical protein
MRGKNAYQRAWRKEKKKEERNNDSPYFQIKGISSKRERDSWSKEYKKYIELGTIWKIPHTCMSWSKCMTYITLRSGFWLSKIWDASMPQFHTYPKLHSKAFSGRVKRRQNIKMPWWGFICNTPGVRLAVSTCIAWA